ncbi:transposable element Tcb2 transposase [Trichonephila inaurata madagascariensis]|uniref:Transposable element Tcb2 transposase n=1 Tax=Trichonephila inaurata madagascariensis TaxID=2747483 RepID=A0A8X6YDX9_9ARAC|nr:transposable element Tcb2 transposase [Trichonephila inaurata madagascariensis]
MMVAGWSARRVPLQLDRFDCVVRWCWGQWIQEMSFTRRPGLGHPRKTSHREDRPIVRNARVQPTASSAAIQAQSGAAHEESGTAAKWNQVVFSDESRFNLGSDDNCARVWRPRGECLNPAFALLRHTFLTAGVMVWGAISYNTRSPIVLTHGTMTAQRHVHDILQPHVFPLMQRLPGAIFQQDAGLTRQGCHKTVFVLLLPFFGLPDP